MVAASFQPHGPEAAVRHEFERADSGKTWLTVGRGLMTTRLAIALDTPRTSRLLFCGSSGKGSASKPDEGDA